MTYSFRWLRSLVFVGQMYLMMPVFALFFTIPALLSRDWAYRGIRTYCHWVRWTARWMVGLRSELRGTPPKSEALIAAKHQSFFDIIILFSETPRPKFIMKKELRWAPIFGWYALRIGCVPVDRGKKGAAISGMVEAARKGRNAPGQLIIYPQGTRVAPGASRPYKVGAGVLYEEFSQDCFPAATNVGVFWPRTGVFRKSGLAVVEFLPVIKAGMPVETFMAHLEEVVENASDRLMAEAGFRKEG